MFYIINFSYIGLSIFLGIYLLLVKKSKYARRITQLLVGIYMLVFLGICDHEKCVSCGACKRVCPMDVDMTDNSRKRKNGTECILCLECTKACPKNAL